MTKKQAPTFSQLSYIVTGILAAHVQRGDELSQTVIEKAVFATKTAAEAIEDIVNEYTDDEDESIKEDPFKDYPWSDKEERYTDLANHLRAQGVTSNRRKADLINKALDVGIIYKDGTKERPKYHYKGLDKPLPNDETRDLPFEKPDNNDLEF